MDNRKFEADEKTAASGQQRIAAWVQNKRLLWISALAVLLVIALIVGLIVVPTSSEDEEPQQEVMTSSEAPEPEPSEEPEVILDSDGDGIPDEVEIAGWETEDGTIYHTDPHNADTDSDGLSDLEEAGDVVSGEDLETIYVGITDPTKADSDDDGLDDKTELHGWTTSRGLQFTTDPMNPDSDGDGLPDGVEAGEASENAAGEIVYSGFSNPTVKDTDRDGLSDLEEADNGTNPYVRDTDGDRLDDHYEVKVIGTDPLSKDTDGDGHDDFFEDSHREDQGLDPLFAEEVAMTSKEYGLEFAKGALAGDAAPGDNLAWLAGNLSAIGVGMTPGPGWIFSTLGDLRDIIVNVLKQDWVAVGFSITSLVPYGGDTANASWKISNFATKNPHLIAGVGALLVTHKYLPSNLKKQISQKIWDGWDSLVDAGASPNALLKLQENGRMNLNWLRDILKGSSHVKGEAVKPFAHWPEAEQHLETTLKKKHRKVEPQKHMSTQGCLNICNAQGRFFDVLANGVAHESKVGYVALTPGIRAQINSDAYFKTGKQIKDAHWHFYPSGITGQMGASKQVIALLEEKGIKYTLHAPIV